MNENMQSDSTAVLPESLAALLEKPAEYIQELKGLLGIRSDADLGRRLGMSSQAVAKVRTKASRVPASWEAKTLRALNGTHGSVQFGEGGAPIVVAPWQAPEEDRPAPEEPEGEPPPDRDPDELPEWREPPLVASYQPDESKTGESSELSASAESAPVQEGLPRIGEHGALDLQMALAMGRDVFPELSCMEMTWARFVSLLLAEPPRSALTLEQYAKAGEALRKAEKCVRGYCVPAKFRQHSPGQAARAKANLERVHALKIDVELTLAGEARLAADPSAPCSAASIEAVHAALDGLEMVIHVTRSSTPEALRLRVWLLLPAGGLPPEEASRLAHHACDRLEAAGIAVDRGSSVDLVRPAFLPTLNSDQEWEASFFPGKPASLENIPQDYKPRGSFSIRAPIEAPVEWRPVDLDELEVPPSVRRTIEAGAPPGESRFPVIYGVSCNLIRAGVADETILRILADPDYGISDKPLREWGEGDQARAMDHVARCVLGAAHEAVAEERDPECMFEATEGTVRAGPPSLQEWLKEQMLPLVMKQEDDALAALERELPKDEPAGLRERMRRLAEAHANGGEFAFAAAHKIGRVTDEPDKADVRKRAAELASYVQTARRATERVQELSRAIAVLEAEGTADAVPAGLLTAYQEEFFPRAAEHPETLEERRHALAQACSEILASHDVLSLVVATAHRLGVAGEERTIGALYMMATSRLFERAIQVLVYGESSSGKSYTADTVLLRMLPEGETVEISNMSPKALIDLPNLKHRILYMVEGTLLQSRDLADEKAMMVRELISRGYLQHLRDVQDPVTGLYRTQILRNDGPISFITTTTGDLHPEIETRMIKLHMDSSEPQTRTVLRKMAVGQGREGELPEGELASWHAYQEWLSLGPLEAEIPYLLTLAEKMSATQNRARRDFKQLILLIRAHAVMHQNHRQFDDQGRIVATLDDYERARDILVDMMARSEGTAVSEGVRRLVGLIHEEAVQVWERDRPYSASEMTYEALKASIVPMSTATIAIRLKCSRGSAGNYAKEAIEVGYLTNHQTYRGHRMLLSLDVPLPQTDDYEHVLPSRQQVEAWLSLEEAFQG